MKGEKAVSVIGIGKLGMPIAACFAKKGCRVIGVDVDPDVVMQVNECRPAFYEPGLAGLLRDNRDRITATGDFAEAVSDSDISFILVPTPSLEDGAFSLELVAEAGARLGAALKEKEDYHLFVLTSTVMPGETGGVLMPLLEEMSGKTCGRHFGLCYSPEFVALGSVVHDVLNPDFILIGESDPTAGEALEDFYGIICDNEPPVARTNFVNAELTKLAVNTFVTTKITFANVLARVCERLPGADVDQVTNALGLDGRIGTRYLKGAIGYGGPCFPRDNLAFCHLLDTAGVSNQLAKATHDVNRQQVAHLAELVLSRLPENGVAGILGLAYKPDTGVVEQAQGLILARLLVEGGARVLAFDPVGMEGAESRLEKTVEFAASAEECASGSDVLVIATPWEQFARIPGECIRREGPQRIVIDCWRILDREVYQPICEYIELGIYNSGNRSGHE